MCFLYTDLGVLISSSPLLWGDNLSVMYLTTSLVFHVRMKYVEIDYYFVHDMVAQKELERDKFTFRHVLIKPIYEITPVPAAEQSFL